jgi:hypothetical protein
MDFLFLSQDTLSSFGQNGIPGSYIMRSSSRNIVERYCHHMDPMQNYERCYSLAKTFNDIDVSGDIQSSFNAIKKIRHREVVASFTAWEIFQGYYSRRNNSRVNVWL